MKHNYLFLVSSVCLGAYFGLAYAQISARNTVPETVSSCYINTTAYNRFTRLPMHIDNLIAIIRKIERKNPLWGMRQIARTMINRYTFDGIYYNPLAKPEFAFIPETEEAAKTEIVKKFIPIPTEEIFPTGTLDNDEMCALHWMLSHSMNSTARDEEIGYNPYNPYNPQGQSGYDANYNTNTNNNNNQYGSSNRWKRDLEDSQTDTSNDNNPLELSGEESPKPPPSLMSQSESDEGTSQESNGDENGIKPSVVVPILGGRSLPSLPQDPIVPGSPKSARQVSTNEPGKTRRPVETGVVYTKWGSISAGRLIGGIAAALENVIIPVNGFGSPYPSQTYGSNGGSNGYSNPNQGSSGGAGGYNYNNRDTLGNPNYNTNNNREPINPNPFVGGSANPPLPSYGSKNQWSGRRKRQTGITLQALENIFAATIAGDVGQSAILNGKNNIPSSVLPPKGVFNDTGCPREYILDQHPNPSQEIFDPSASWSFLTEAEIRGGMDGLILGSKMSQLDPGQNKKLSDILSMYYSETGVSESGSTSTAYRSCDRGVYFNGIVDSNKLNEQARSFAFLFNNYTKAIPSSSFEADPRYFYNMVDEANARMSQVIGQISSSDLKCTRQPGYSSGTVERDDALKYTEVRNTIYAVLDHSVTTAQELDEQKRFLAKLTEEINVSPSGSRLGVIDGNSGYLLINPNLTDIQSRLACNIMAIPNQMKTQNLPQALNIIRGELEKRQEEERRNEVGGTAVPSNGILILILVQGRKLEVGNGQIRNSLSEIQSKFGDAHVIFASSKYQQNDFDGIALDPASNFMKIQPNQNISDSADEFVNELRKNTQSRLTYPRCHSKNYDQDNEHLIATDFFITPDTLQYYEISPDYFYSARKLLLRFTSDYGRIRICDSRTDRFPNSKTTGSCRETQGTYIPVGSSTVDLELSYDKPCGKHGKREGCQPIYLSFTPTLVDYSSSLTRDCSVEGCQTTSDVKVTFTHWDMRCNGALGMITVSLPLALFASILSLFTWRTIT